MRVITLNVNGLRSAARKGIYEWLAGQGADIVCLQETKAQEQQLASDRYGIPGYCAYFHDAEKRGYSGVALYGRKTPDRVVAGLGWGDLDREGRWLQADFGRLSFVSLYLPSGSSGAARQAVKLDFLTRLAPVLRSFRRRRREYVLCGDWNIAHRAIDLENWRANQKNSGFLPEERAWMDELFGPLGFVDAFRLVNQEPRQYTWWSNRGRAWAKNVGWRIDYQVITPGLRDKVVAAAIYKEQRFSDHAPLIIDYDLTL